MKPTLAEPDPLATEPLDTDALNEDEPETGPLRRCLVTRQRMAREEMLRFVAGPARELVFDAPATLPGRGMWLSPSGIVIQQAVQRGVFTRAAKAPLRLPEDLPAAVLLRLRLRVTELLGLARRSGAALAGFEKAREWLQAGKAGVIIQAADGSMDERARFLGGRDVKAFAPLTASALGQVFGRDHVVHVAIAGGRLARMIEIEAARCAGVANEAASGQLGPASAKI